MPTTGAEHETTACTFGTLAVYSETRMPCGLAPHACRIAKYVSRGHPGLYTAAKDTIMAASALYFQFFKGVKDAGRNGGEMDIADQFQQTPLLLAENRLVAVLEEVAMPPMTTTFES